MESNNLLLFNPGKSGGASSSVSSTISQTAHGFTGGEVVRFDGTNYVKAQADSAADSEVIGIVASVASADVFTLIYTGVVTGLSGLTAGTTYFLDPATAGALTATEPVTVGQISKALLIALSTTSGVFINMRGSIVT